MGLMFGVPLQSEPKLVNSMHKRMAYNNYKENYRYTLEKGKYLVIASLSSLQSGITIDIDSTITNIIREDVNITDRYPIAFYSGIFNMTQKGDINFVFTVMKMNSYTAQTHAYAVAIYKIS